MTDHEFAEIWNSSADREEVAKRTGLSIQTVRNKAYSARRRGIILKHFVRSGPRQRKGQLW